MELSVHYTPKMVANAQSYSPSADNQLVRVPNDVAPRPPIRCQLINHPVLLSSGTAILTLTARRFLHGSMVPAYCRAD